MSDNWVTFLSLDASESEAAEIIDRQLQWLLDREIVAPTENTDRFYGDYREGARFSEACDPRWVPSDAIAGGWHILFGVRIEKGWQISSNMNGFEPPCPRCGEHLAADLMGELLTAGTIRDRSRSSSASNADTPTLSGTGSTCLAPTAITDRSRSSTLFR